MFRLSFFLAVLWVPALVLARPANNDVPAEPPLDVLQQVQEAARTLDYAGVYTYQQGVLLMSSRVVHLVDGTGERERTEILDGPPREYLRHNDTVTTILPERKTVVVEKQRVARFPGLLLSGHEGLHQHYEIISLPDLERVAGRECTRLRVQPRDAVRYGYLLCVDNGNHLLLKVQTVTASNEVIDQVAFTSLTLGEEAAKMAVSSSYKTDDWQHVELPLKSVDLTGKGWRIPHPAGFAVMTQVSRPLRVYGEVGQMVLSDGLAAISVFIESFDAQRHRATEQGGMHKGALSVFRKRIGDFWLTALGQVPADTLRDIIEHVEYVPLAR